MNMDKETYRQVVNALAVIGLTLEHADYLFDNDSKAMKQVDEALLLAGIDAPMLRNRQVDRILEDTVAFNANAFENMTSEPEPTGVTEDHANMVEIMDMIEGEFDDTHTEEEYLAEKGTDDWVKHLEQQGANPFKQHSLDQRGPTDVAGQLHHRRRSDRRKFRPHEDGWDNRSACGYDRRTARRRRPSRPRDDDRFLGR